MGRWSQRRQRGGSGGVTLPAPDAPATGANYGLGVLIVTVGQEGCANWELFASTIDSDELYVSVATGAITGATTNTGFNGEEGTFYKSRVQGDGVLLSGWSPRGFAIQYLP